MAFLAAEIVSAIKAAQENIPRSGKGILEALANLTNEMRWHMHEMGDGKWKTPAVNNAGDSTLEIVRQLYAYDV